MSVCNNKIFKSFTLMRASSFISLLYMSDTLPFAVFVCLYSFAKIMMKILFPIRKSKFNMVSERENADDRKEFHNGTYCLYSYKDCLIENRQKPSKNLS